MYHVIREDGKAATQLTQAKLDCIVAGLRLAEGENIAAIARKLEQLTKRGLLNER